MKPPSIEIMMIAARGLLLLLALATLAWAIVRWRRDTSRDAQRMFEQLDLMRAELLQLQGQVGQSSMSSAAMMSSSAPLTQHSTPHQPGHSSQRETINQANQQVTPYPDYDAERAAITASRAKSRHSSMDAVKTKSMTNAAPRGYEVAARLARSGANCEELMNTCALSRHEAELLVRLHAGMKSMQPPATTSAKQGDGTSQSARKANSNPAAHANLNQLKNIGNRSAAAAAKPAQAIVNRSPSGLRPLQQQRVSLVG